MKPKLYALLVGVTGYANPDYDTLQFSAHDAESLAKALETQKGGLYADVQTKVVERRRPSTTCSTDSTGCIMRRQSAISPLSSCRVTASSTGSRQFWFLTREADLARLRATAISNDDLLDSLPSVPGKKILFIDACHAGAALTRGLKAPTAERPGHEQGGQRFLHRRIGPRRLRRLDGTEVAKEDEQWKRHGAFTEALIEAIGEGKAANGRSEPITTDLLDHYVVERVKDMTGATSIRS